MQQNIPPERLAEVLKIPYLSIIPHLISIGFARVSKDEWNWQNVSSPFVRLYYVTEGSATINIADVANRERKVPYDWIREDGMGVTDDFVRYVRPLVQGEVTPLFVGGLPHHIQMLTWGR